MYFVLYGDGKSSLQASFPIPLASCTMIYMKGPRRISNIQVQTMKNRVSSELEAQLTRFILHPRSYVEAICSLCQMQMKTRLPSQVHEASK